MNKLFIALILIGLGSQGFAAATPTATAPGSKPPTTTAETVVTKTPAAYLLYRYQGDRYRDPFIPLIGDARTDLYDRPPQVASLVLKGIVEDERGRMALLTSGLASYVLRGGRLYDGRNKVVKTISGVVKSRSVILIGSDRTVRELKVVSKF